MFLELVLNATVATATAATQAMHIYHVDTATTASTPTPTAPPTTRMSSTAGAAAVPSLSCPSCSPSSEVLNSSVQRGDELYSSESTFMTITGAYTNNVHGATSLVTCALGIPMNVLNIWVLTRRHMRTPVNCILTWLAVFDLLTMLSYVPFSLHFYVLWSNSVLSAEKNTLGWMTFLLFHSSFTATTHTVSIWLGVTLAMFRYKHIFSPAKGHITRVRRLVRARIAVFVVVVASIVVMIPNYLMTRIMRHVAFIPETNKTEVLFYMEDLKLGTPEMKPMTAINLWMQCILAKFLPCILMVVYSGLLVRTVRMNVRMLERRRTGSRPSESLGGPRVSIAEHSSEGDYSTRKSVDLGKCAKNKKRKNKYQEINKSQDSLGDHLDKTPNGSKKENETAMRNGASNGHPVRSSSHQQNLYQRCCSSCYSAGEPPCRNGSAKGCSNPVDEADHCHLHVPGQDHPPEHHSGDSGVYSNSSHEHLTYEKQCQLNHKQKQPLLSESSKKNNNRLGNNANNCKKLKGGCEDSNHQSNTSLNATGCQDQLQKGQGSHHLLVQSQNKRNSLSAAESEAVRRARCSSSATSAGIPAQNTRSQDSVRTTRMLLVVIILFLVTELPQGFVIALSVTIPGFFGAVYIPLGDIMDQLALLNNAINFLLYCSMSRDFRTTLLEHFHAPPRWCSWFSSCPKTSRAGDCPGFRLRQRKRKQMVLANDV